MERKEKTQLGLPTKPSMHACQDIQYYMEHISESGSPPHGRLAVSLPISVIAFDILYHLFYCSLRWLLYYVVQASFKSS